MCGLPSHHHGRGSRTTGAKHSQVSSPSSLLSLSNHHSLSSPPPSLSSLSQFVNSICDSLPFFQFSLFLCHLFCLSSHLPLSFLLFPDPLPSPFFSLNSYCLHLSTPPSPSFLPFPPSYLLPPSSLLPLPPFLPPPPPFLSLPHPPDISSSLARCHSMLVTMQ